jgi:hypothetical protein
MPNAITTEHLTEGAPWTFVHVGGPRAGDHDFFTFEKQHRPGGPGTLSPIHSLLNVETGGRAWVSEKWLREGATSTPTHGYWLIGHVAALPVAA